MRIISYLTFFAIIAAIAFACVQPPEYPLEPVIENPILNKNGIAQGSASSSPDTLYVTFSYTDGDGNLGNADDGVFDVVLVDSRDGFENPFRIPTIPDQGVGNGISGEITVGIPNLFMCCIFEDKNGQDPCTPSTAFPTDTLAYDIYILDRDGNESNRIRTEPIVLLCN